MPDLSAGDFRQKHPVTADADVLCYSVVATRPDVQGGEMGMMLTCVYACLHARAKLNNIHIDLHTGWLWRAGVKSPGKIKNNPIDDCVHK